MKFSVENYRGLKSVECMLPDQGLVLVGGDNGAGKSSFARGLAGLLANKPNPTDMSPAVRSKWFGRAGGKAILTLETSDWIKTQKGISQSQKGEALTVNPSSVGLVNILDLKGNKVVEALELILIGSNDIQKELPRALAKAILGGSSTKEEVDKALVKEDIAYEIDQVMNNLGDGSIAQWARLSETYLEQRRRAGAAWKKTVGEGHNFGEVKAASFRPAGWHGALETVTVEDLREKSKDLDAQYREYIYSKKQGAGLEKAVERAQATFDSATNKITDSETSIVVDLAPLKDSLEQSKESVKGLDVELDNLVEPSIDIKALLKTIASEGHQLGEWQRKEDLSQKSIVNQAAIADKEHWLAHANTVGTSEKQPVECPHCFTELDLSGGVLNVYIDPKADIRKVEAEVQALKALPVHASPGAKPVRDEGLEAELAEGYAAEDAYNKEKSRIDKEIASHNQTIRGLEIEIADAIALDENASNRLAKAKGEAKMANEYLQKAKADLKDFQDNVVSVEDIEAVQAQIAEVEHDINRVRIHSQAQTYYADWRRANAIAVTLSPTGWRRHRVANLLNPVRKDLQSFSKAIVCEDIEISEDMGLTFGGRPFEVLSDSEKFRCKVGFRLCLAKLLGDSVVIIDAADILDDDSLWAFQTKLERFALRFGMLLVITATGRHGDQHAYIHQGTFVPMEGRLAVEAVASKDEA